MAPLRIRSRRLLVVLGAGLLALAALASPAAANVISPEPAHSPNTDDTATIYWIGLAVMVALIAVVNGALIYAVVRYRRRRGEEPRQLLGGRRLQVRVSAGLAALAVAIFVLGVVFTEKAREAGAEPLKIEATGQQWLWRYDYPNGAFSYYKLVVPVDTPVELDLVSTDVVHGWFVPQLSGKFEAVPGKLNRAWFRADETGDYEGSSSTFSGPAYSAERTEVEVVEEDEYKAFIDQQKSDIQAAQDQVVSEIESGEAP